LRRIVSTPTLVAGALLFAGIVVHACFWWLAEPRILFNDFYKAYYPAAKQLWRLGPRQGWIAGDVSFVDFVNLPIVGYLFTPLLSVGDQASAWAFLAVGLVAVVAAAALLIRQFCSGRWAAVLVAVLFLVNGPLANSLREGNLTHIILFLLVLGISLWRSGREFPAGLVFGACAVLKPPLLLLGLFFVVIGRWRVVAGGASAVIAAAGLSLAVHGIDVNVDWYRNSIAPYLGWVVPAFNNQSLDGFLIRFWTGERYLFDWRPFVPTDLHKVIRSILVPLAYGGVFWTIWRTTRRGEGASERDGPARAELLGFCATLTLAITTSPVAWTHYYLLLLIPFAMVIGDASRYARDRLSFGLMVAAMVLASLPVVVLPINPGLTAAIVARSVLSAWFFAGLLCLAALVIALWRDRPATDPLAPDETPDGAVVAIPARRLTIGLAAFLLLNAVILNVLVWWLTPAPVRDSVLRHSMDVLAIKVGDDSWGAMAIAEEHVKARGAATLYDNIFFDQSIKFQYPPSSLFALRAMTALAPRAVRTADDMFVGKPALNDVIGWLVLLIVAVSTWLLFEKRLAGAETAPIDISRMAALRLVIAIGLTMTFYPLVKAFTLGQIQLWISGLFAVALLCWMVGYRTFAGLLIGAACLIKPHYGLLVLWGAWRREWGFVAGAAAVAILGLAASLATFGWEAHLDYVQVLTVLSRHGEGFYPNQSINGLLNRLMSIGEPGLYDNLTFSVGRFPPFNPLIYGLTVVSSLMLLALAVWPFPGNRDRITAFCVAALAITVASPIAWEHHYAILLPIFAIALADTLQNRRWLIVVILCYVFVSNYFPIANLLAGSVLNIAQSTLFFAALTLLAGLLAGFRSSGVPGGTFVREERLS